MPDEPATTVAPDAGTTPAAPAADAPPTWTANPSLTKFGGDPEKLATSYLELEKSFSGRVKLPGEKATEEEWGAFHKALGRPEKPDDYKIDLPAMPEGLPQNGELLKTFLPVFHAAGLTQKQVQQIATKYAEAELAEYQTRKTQEGTIRQENLAELEQAWGATYKQQMALGDKAVQEWGDADLRELLQHPVIGTEPALRRFLAKIGQLGLEGKYYDADAVGAAMQSPAELDTRIAAIKADPAYWSDFGEHAAKHDALVKELNTLVRERALLGRR